MRSAAPVTSLVSYLRRLAAVAGVKQPAYRYASYAEVVLRHGASWSGSQIPAEVRRGEVGMCFANAARLALSQPQLLYTEGWAFPAGSNVPIEHGWCIDTTGGAVVDPTWPKPGEAYVGVVLAQSTLVAALERTGYFGVLGQDWRCGSHILRHGIDTVDGLGDPLPEGTPLHHVGDGRGVRETARRSQWDP